MIRDPHWKAPKWHCQSGGDVCLAGNFDGICCPDDSCDVDDGVRPRPEVVVRAMQLTTAQPDSGGTEHG